MGMQERWQRRQGEIVAVADSREAERVRRHNDRVEERHGEVVRAARQAFERGDGWFEAEIEGRSTGSMTPGAFPSDFGTPPLHTTKLDHPAVQQPPRADLLSRIEDEGWSLHTAQYLHIQLGENSREKWTSSGEQVAIKGKIVGMYLFRRAGPGGRAEGHPARAGLGHGPRCQRVLLEHSHDVQVHSPSRLWARRSGPR
ncbi:hypothetical protein ACFY93_11905 [Streptomyces sp. NPDC008313]|uniref:hypothetical protein n=1 Tax=Streptomyces sp. NPDC008313 TaxID=3364826 RepID=UPI0036E340EB